MGDGRIPGSLFLLSSSFSIGSFSSPAFFILSGESASSVRYTILPAIVIFSLSISRSSILEPSFKIDMLWCIFITIVLHKDPTLRPLIYQSLVKTGSPHIEYVFVLIILKSLIFCALQWHMFLSIFLNLERHWQLKNNWSCPVTMDVMRLMKQKEHSWQPYRWGLCLISSVNSIPSISAWFKRFVSSSIIWDLAFYSYYFSFSKFMIEYNLICWI